MKKYFSVAAWVDFDAMPDVYIVVADSEEAAKEEVKKLYDNAEIELETHNEIDLSLPMQKVFPCWWDHIE
jgi:hypothetical protein